jgi:xylulokinase
VVVVPYLAGERTPNRPDATGTITGLRPDVSRECLARAAVEGVVCGLLDGLDALSAAGVPTGGRLFLVGGGARSAAYRRIVADLSQRPVTVAPTGEHVALGMCVQAAAVLHGTSIDAVVDAWAAEPGEVVEPDPTHPSEDVRSAYAAARDRWA